MVYVYIYIVYAKIGTITLSNLERITAIKILIMPKNWFVHTNMARISPYMCVCALLLRGMYRKRRKKKNIENVPVHECARSSR